MNLPKLSTPPSDFLVSMEAYVAEAPHPYTALAEGEAPAPAKVCWCCRLILCFECAGGGAGSVAYIVRLALRHWT